MTRSDAVNFLLKNPYKLGHALGFTLLTELHNQWIIDMVRGTEDKTLQAHRGSYKTTCVSLAIAIIMILLPKKKVMFMRKTDADTKEIIVQVRKILESPYMTYLASTIYNTDFKLITATYTNITTNLNYEPKGTAQLSAMGVNGSLTGKHFDIIFTDDIVNVEDRISRAEREHTKIVYQELQNIKNRGGRIYNSGTPWHKEDCFTLMPNIVQYDCYTTGLINQTELSTLKSSMTASLFAANYELKHIADDEVLFPDPITGEDPAMAEQGRCHVDAAYGGEDYTAFTICRKYEGKYYVFGKLWHKHVDECIEEIIRYRQAFNAGRISMETNGDKGYLSKAFRAKGELTAPYPEKMNKFLKITTYLKGAWKDVVFVSGTDESYINQVCEYNENAEHDDAPDSLASLIRLLWNKKGEDQKYQSLFG